VQSRLLQPCLRSAFNSADKASQGLLGGLLANLQQLEKMVRAVGATRVWSEAHCVVL
jgi:hypothetical protein